MNNGRDHTRDANGEALRLSPLAAFVAWVARLLACIASLKRRKTFPPDWKDRWKNLQQAEWACAQLLALCVREVRAGRSLNTDAAFDLALDPPEDYGACPSSPRAMNQRFIQIARFQLDPNRYILRHLRRIARREGLDLHCDADGCPYRLAVRAMSAAPGAEAHRAAQACLAGGLSRGGAPIARRGDRDSSGVAQARAPPAIPFPQTPIRLAGHVSEVAFICAAAHQIPETPKSRH